VAGEISNDDEMADKGERENEAGIEKKNDAT
jgi:hypothetical protein